MTLAKEPVKTVAPLEPLQRLRSYSRRTPDGQRETWDQTCDRTLYSPHLGLQVLGQFTDEEMALIDEMQRSKTAFGSARWLWVGGTEWIANPSNYSGAFNCTSTRITDWDSFGYLMDLAMQGSGTGAVVELDCIEQLPAIINQLEIEFVGEIGSRSAGDREEFTSIESTSFSDSVDEVLIEVGDSRKGWVAAYQYLMELSSNNYRVNFIKVKIDLSSIRPSGQVLKGFGGVANPIRLPETFVNCARILNGALGRKLNSLEVCLLIGEGAAAVVAGNVRRSAGIRQGSADDENFTTSKDNLWTQENGNWRIDPKRDALRTANHTRVFHRKPTLEECVESVRKQFWSGEGAIQYAPEAIARGNADLLDTPEKKKTFLELYNYSPESAEIELTSLIPGTRTGKEIEHRMQRYAQNPCAEIIGGDAFHCNLGSVHLNTIDPFDFKTQEKAFKASALQTAAYLNRGFTNHRYQYSREVDPIVGVSFTGLFTFFVKAFGADWLKWWQAGRPSEWGEISPEHMPGLVLSLSTYFENQEREYFTRWREIVHKTVWDYCDRHGLKRPNRCTTLKPEGSLTLLTGVGACGWHPPKAKHYIRRMTFGAHDPIALAAIDYGYTVVPSQSCKDDNGNLLDDPFDSRVTEWLVEVPIEEPWANLPGVENINPSAFPVEAQFDFYMQVQKYYTTHNTSATIEIYEHEIEKLAGLIHGAIANDEGYISAAVMGRSEGNNTFPRLPFEPISRERYQELVKQVSDRRKSNDFMALISKYDTATEYGPADSACDSGICSLK